MKKMKDYENVPWLALSLITLYRQSFGCSHINIFFKRPSFEEFNCTERSLSFSVPCAQLKQYLHGQKCLQFDGKVMPLSSENVPAGVEAPK